jgi:NAD(P)-dependent dehydrogenase (short-subunit alcohol dehydrogenase family)
MDTEKQAGQREQKEEQEQKIVVITGAASGLGREALALLARSSEVRQIVAVVRQTSLRDLAAFLEEEGIEKEGIAAKVRLEAVDLVEPQSIDALIERLRDLPRIDVLINNAGLFMDRRETNSSGIEKQMMVNYLAPRRLTLGLWNLLLRSSHPRVLNLTSRLHRRGRIDLDRFTRQTETQNNLAYSGAAEYANSKLALTAWTCGLARRTGGRVTLISQHPGVYATGITRRLAAPLRFLWNAFISGPEKGARFIVEAALKLEIASGSYLDRDRLSHPASLALDHAFQDGLEEATERLLPTT